MNESPDARQLILAYRLRELSPDDRREIEERMLVDQAFSDQLQEAEYDLIDDYHALRLSPAERRRVRAAFSREQLSVGPLSALQPRPSRSALRPWLRSQSAWRFRLAVAAAILVFFTATGWLAVSRYFRAPAVLRSAAPATPAPPFAAPGETASPPASAHAASQAQDNTTALLLLVADVTRGAEGALLELHPFTRVVRVQWTVPPGISAQRFSLTVAQSGKILARVQQHEALQTVGNTRVAEFRVDASTFAGVRSDPHFLLLVSMNGSSGSLEAEYPVFVSRRKQ